MRGQSVMPYGLRPMDADDLDQVASMEREAFPTLWPPTSYRRELKNRMAEYAVCVRDGEFVTVPAKPGRKGLFGLFGRLISEQQSCHSDVVFCREMLALLGRLISEQEP